MSYPLLGAFLTMMWFFLWLLWIYLIFWIIWDIFRSHDLSGFAKAGWVLLVIVLPFIGVFTYLIVRGSTMHERQPRDRAYRSHDRNAPETGSVDDLARLADLRDRNVISENEFQQEKAKILS